MPYTDLATVLAAFPPALSAIGVGSYSVTTTQINSVYIYFADAQVDAYISNRYVVPVTPGSPILQKLSTDLVVYELFRDRGLRVPDFMNDRYQNAIAMLEMIAKGKMKIPGATEVETGDNFAMSTAQGYHSIFSPVLEDIDQRVDPDLVERERERRWPYGVNTP